MKFVSTGTPVASPSCRDDGSDGRAGFTLLEALVALALVLAFASAVGPHLSQARRIIANSEGRVAAQVLLRSLLDAPFDRSDLSGASREGETNGLRWRIAFEPAEAVLPRDQTKWSAYRVVASVTWAPDQLVMAETMRLGKLDK
jgi:prepilin-type N-terminal cleavage/methylation domain-containing protein